ncbi:MAG TPA: MerR family transcriptional regulator [Actinomycetota bacterium]|nr:MerR family transcriptional regulator [Actinomycetota bacterium]
MTTALQAPLRIGQLAERLGVTTRTIRYYEELGLLKPSGYTEGGERRYTEDDATHLQRILELKTLMGFGLEEIRATLDSEQRLSELREEYKSGSKKRKLEIVHEAMEINQRMRAQVESTIKRSKAFLRELEAKAARYREVEAELEG